MAVVGGEGDAAKTVTVACLVAVGAVTGAEAQQTLPPVTVDAPVTRPKPAAAKPTAEELRVRAALRRQRQQQRQQAQNPAPASAAAEVEADRNPYANAEAPYKAERLASPKFTEPLVNTPRSVTVLTKELLQDKNATTLKEVARTTAGVTLGTGEGGNAFGDRFFIRGFDARNDIFVDGIRDPAVSIRENFFTEQVEILRGPASSYAGRGTAGGAINIVTKQAGDKNFYNTESTIGTDNTKRVMVDVNQVITPAFSVRLDGLFQEAKVSERRYVFDDRWGALAAVKWQPTDQLKVTANYIHTDLDQLPDFGVPYNTLKNLPYPSAGVGASRDTFYGFINRDFQQTKQDIGTVTTEFKLNDQITVNNRFRAETSILNYIGTLPERPDNFNLTVSLNPQSRYQVTNVIADQTDVTIKYDTGPIRNTSVVGTEVSRENIKRDSYTGLSSEALPGGFAGNGSLAGQSIFNPPNELPFSNSPQLTGNPTLTGVQTNSIYYIHTANYNDFIILNGGVRLDDYAIKSNNLTGSSVSAGSDMVNYNVGLVVKPLPYVSLYTAYATSSNPVGAELDGTSALYGALSPTVTRPQVFDPEQNKAFEVGAKAELFDGKLLATAAWFQTTKENAREVIPTGLANAGAIVAGAAYRVQGWDFGLSGKITDKWSIYGGVVVMTDQVTNSVVPTNIGLRLANVADTSFNLLTKYKITPDWELGGQATYRSKVFGGTLLAANSLAVLPDYWRFDSFLEYKLTKNYRFKIFANNIFDTLYYDALYQSASPFVFVAPGRSVSFVLETKFN